MGDLLLTFMQMLLNGRSNHERSFALVLTFSHVICLIFSILLNYNLVVSMINHIN